MVQYKIVLEQWDLIQVDIMFKYDNKVSGCFSFAFADEMKEKLEGVRFLFTNKFSIPYLVVILTFTLNFPITTFSTIYEEIMN